MRQQAVDEGHNIGDTANVEIDAAAMSTDAAVFVAGAEAAGVGMDVNIAAVRASSGGAGTNLAADTSFDGAVFEGAGFYYRALCV